MRKLTVILLASCLMVIMPGCGGNTSAPGGPPLTNGATSPVSLTVTDTPPTGVQVLFFQLSITGALMLPGNVSLLNTTNPVPVNVSQLQAETAFLGTADVATGTYTSLNLTFSNPQLTIFNGTGAAIGSCATNTVCQLTPTTTPLTLTFSSSPFPVTVAVDTPLAFKLDIHLNTIIQPDMTVNLAATNGVSIEQLPPAPASGPVAVLGNLIGTIQGLGTNQFTLQSGDGRSLTIGVNSNTDYNFPSCAAGNFSCLATGQIVEVGVSLQQGGTVLATSVSYRQPAGQQVVEGNIIGLSTSSGNTIMQLILQKRPPTASALPIGQRAAVTVPSTGVTFSVDSNGFTIPGVLTFGAASDLMVGQEVQVVVMGTVTTATGSGTSTTGPLGPAPAISFTANSVALEPSQITGTVATVNLGGLSFSINTFPNFFLPPGPVAAPPTFAPVPITVATTTQTNFQNFTPDTIQGISVGGVVSVGGWLFSTPTGATLSTIAAKEVLGRPGPIPLF